MQNTIMGLAQKLTENPSLEAPGYSVAMKSRGCLQTQHRCSTLALWA